MTLEQTIRALDDDELPERLADCKRRYAGYQMMPLGMNVVPAMERNAWEQRLICAEMERRKHA